MTHNFRHLAFVSLFLFSGIVVPLQGSCQDQQDKYAGEFFGVPVPVENYYFVKNAVAIFGRRGGEEFKDEQDKEDYIWEQLLLSFEAFRRGVQASQDEVDAEVDKILKAEKVKFDFRKDKPAYEAWVKAKIGEPSVAFENQIRHLLQLEKLKAQVIDGIKPEVSRDEALQKFRNEYNTLSVELALFDGEQEAKEFYGKARGSAAYWDEYKKGRQDKFKRPGFVSLEFLMDIWKFPRDASYAMMKLKPGDVYQPAPVYKGFAVFKVLEVRVAQDSEFEKQKERYFEKIRQQKKYAGYGQWLEQFKQLSGMKRYPITEPGAPVGQQETKETKNGVSITVVNATENKGGVK